MKFLILLIILACGKHQEPAAQDLHDDDGDQLINELDADKNIADFETLKSVTGFIKIQQSDISFTNHSDLKENTLKLLAGDLTSIEKNQFFSEWSELKLNFPTTFPKENPEYNTLHFYFNKTDILPGELILLDGKAQRVLADWSEYFKIQLSKSELNGLINGKLRLALRKKFPHKKFFSSASDESIKVKTYKVHVHDGNHSKIMYVSKSLSLKGLLEHLEISNVTVVDDESLFFNSLDQSGDQWFVRNENGNIALMFTTIHKLKSSFYERFERKKISLVRNNGSATSSIKLNNKENSRIYLIVRPLTKNIRTFADYTEVTTHQSGSRNHGSDDSWACQRYMRKISEEKVDIPTFSDFLKNLTLELDMEMMTVNEQADDKGIFWEIMISNPAPSLELTLQGLKPSSFTTIGQYAYDCGHKGKGSTAASPAHSEGKLSFEIESFVEKLQ